MFFFILVVVCVLELYLDVNFMIDGDYKVIYKYKDILIVVLGLKGFMVFVIWNVENLFFRGVEDEVKRLVIWVCDG